LTSGAAGNRSEMRPPIISPVKKKVSLSLIKDVIL
jgi:hypothetical protein